MRATTTNLLVLTIAACANNADPAIPYDEVAQTLASDVATPAGGDVTALADAVVIAHGGMPAGFTTTSLGIVSGTHDDGICYMYKVICYGSDEKLLATCGETTTRAIAITVWAAPGMRHEGLWTLRGIDTHQSWATGTTWSLYESVLANKEATVLLDLDRLVVIGGTMTANIEIDDVRLTADIVFERIDRARIQIDDRGYWLDPTTGDFSIATQLY